LAIRDGDAQEAARLQSVKRDVFDRCRQAVVVSRVSGDLLV